MAQRNQVHEKPWLMFRLSALTELHTLRLQGCENPTDEGLWHVTALCNLHTLDLSKCRKLTEAGLSHLMELPNLLFTS
jgi:F-box/leucine-rich repeat protein 14